MIDPKLLRQSAAEVAANLARRGFEFDAEAYLALEERRKALQVETEQLQSERNASAKSIGKAKARGEEIEPLLAAVKDLGDRLEASEKVLQDVQAQLRDIELGLPNLMSDDVPTGDSEDDNTEVRKWGEPVQLGFEARDHIALGENLGQLDFDSASKISGARFVVMKGQLARLQRALIQFMLDTHTGEHGYTETYVPYLVKSRALIGTGQLPKFEEDQFKTIDESPFYLIPTAEVPVTNLAADVIFDADALPMRYVAHTPCFRSEAGSHGQDTRGMIRQHQFEKVELVQFVAPDASMDALEELTGHAEVILQKLELPYRVVVLCSGDIGFGSAKNLRHRSVVAGAEPLPRNLVLQQLQRFPGAPHESASPQSRNRQAGADPYAQRIGRRRGPGTDRRDGELPARGRQHPRTRGSEALHGRR